MSDVNKDLFDAIRRGHGHRVGPLLWRGADPNARDEYGMTPLMRAGRHGDEAVVETLIEQGADVNARNRFDQTPLMLLAMHPGLISMLVEQGARVTDKDHLHRTAMDYAIRHGVVASVDILGRLGGEQADENLRQRLVAGNAAVAAQGGYEYPLPAPEDGEGSAAPVAM